MADYKPDLALLKKYNKILNENGSCQLQFSIILSMKEKTKR